MTQPEKIAARFIAHARLCRDIARSGWNEADAVKLEQMALDCERAANEEQILPKPG